MANIIEVEDLFFTYRDGTQALKGISLSIPEGSRTALLGPNGAGKSTLLLHLNGIYLAQKGKVRVMGQEVTARNCKWVRSMVGLVFQDPDDQVFSSTVWEDVTFGPVNMRLTADEVERRAGEALAAVNMEKFRDKAPYHLSYGQKKRVAIAGVLAMNPRVIILDEPAAYLDPRGKDTLMEILWRLSNNGTTVVIATHDVDLAAEWAQQILVIKDGRTLAQGDVSILADEKIAGEAGLRFPVVTQIFKHIPELKLAAVPLRISDAVSEIRKVLKETGRDR
ncbi:MAG: ATP-binding cassette domain-containing protein [Pelotomaculum sp.]|uniref:ABC transporter ATP-binding protein n=1 Tax=Pelotomaculum thermopropionicum (strain DSM 13744 / JCM 10971 / SI) TaxID=370438 RepID=A5D1N3_PELTS|nr:ATP-binding cassette domain-containing protein [Pelotomaculum sp.]BAF59835.1 ABC-type cobalt transport system, ATPase component [Pelotomaculum thermopropionicum SI]